MAASFANGRGLKLYADFQARLKILNAADFGDLLPVNLLGIDSKKDLQPLHGMSGWNGEKLAIDAKTNKTVRLPDPWKSIQGPFTVARAEAKPGAVVDEWVQWDDKGADRTPLVPGERVIVPRHLEPVVEALAPAPARR